MFKKRTYRLNSINNNSVQIKKTLSAMKKLFKVLTTTESLISLIMLLGQIPVMIVSEIFIVIFIAIVMMILGLILIYLIVKKNLINHIINLKVNYHISNSTDALKIYCSRNLFFLWNFYL